MVLKSAGPIKALDALETRLQATDDPEHRTMLGLLIRLLGAEMVGDADAVVETVTPDFRYVSYPGTGAERKGAEALHAALAGAHAAGLKLLWLDANQIVVGEGGLAFGGTTYIVMTGAMARQPDPDALYLMAQTMAGFIEFRDGRMSLETTYTTAGDGGLDQVDPADLPGENEIRAWRERFAANH